MSSSLVPRLGVSKKYPSPEDWERVRSRITSLYMDEEKTLPEVMNILARDHNHHGTAKMYKTRITNWGLDKNHKEPEMRAILHKKMQRDAVGKPSAFRVRGKSVTAEDVWKYFRRKGVLQPELLSSSTDAATPEAVEYWTPSPSPKPRPLEKEVPGMKDTFRSSLASFDNGGLGMVSWTPNGESIIGRNHQTGSMSLDEMGRLCSLSPEILTFEMPRSPLPPESLLTPEKLFFNIRAYFSTAFGNGTFLSNDRGRLVRVNEPEKSIQHLQEFQDLCITGSAMIFRNAVVQGRRLLSRACALVENLIKEEHPRALSCILYTLSILESRKCCEVVTLLRSYFGRMAAHLFTVDHPWGQIFLLIGRVDESCLLSAMVEAWHCVSDVFQHHVGQFHLDALDIYTGYISFQLESTTAGKLLLDLLEKAEQEYENADPRICNLRYEYGLCLYDQKRYTEAVDILDNIPVHSRTSKGLGLLAYCFYQMDQTYEAGINIREAIESTERVMGRNNPRKLAHMDALSGWLLEWGRMEESNQLREEIESLIEPDDIDIGGGEF